MKHRIIVNRFQHILFLSAILILLVLTVYSHIRINALAEENQRLEAHLNSAYAKICAQSEFISVARLEDKYEGNKREEISTADFELLVRLVIAEAGAEPIEGQRAVVQCVLDRLNCNTYDWGTTISDVIYRPNQFATPYDGDIVKYPDAIEAVYDVYVLGQAPVDGEVIYFFNPDTSVNRAASSIRNRSDLLATIGRHEFRGEVK